MGAGRDADLIRVVGEQISGQSPAGLNSLGWRFTRRRTTTRERHCLSLDFCTRSFYSAWRCRNQVGLRCTTELGLLLAIDRAGPEYRNTGS